MSFSRKAHVLFLAAVLLTGLGRIALLPPFEGADETAHYSRILAAAFPPANIGERTRIDESVYQYYAAGPMSGGWINNPTMHGADPRAVKAGTVYRDYHEFFAAGKKTVTTYEKLYREQPAARVFSPSPEPNWQIQHPPGYYLLLGWVCRHLPDMSLAGRLFALRAFGFLLAFAGFAIGLEATTRHLAAEKHPQAEATRAFGAFYPFMMPSFFNDLTRMGNDTLALFMFGATWVLLLRHLRKPDERGNWLALGFVLGASLLVKATAIPPAAGILLVLAGRRKKKELMPVAIITLVTAAVSAAWYGPYLARYAFTSGASGLAAFTKGAAHPQAMPWTTLISFATASLFGAVSHFSDWYTFSFTGAAQIAAALPVLWALAAWAIVASQKKKFFSLEALPFWVIAPLLGAIVLHSVFTALAFGAGSSPTPAYYVHVLAPAFALTFGLGLAKLRDGKGMGAGRDITAVLGLVAVVGTADLLKRQAMMYGGCWWEDAATKTIGHSACLRDPVLLFRHLGVLAWPGPGFACLAAGFLCAITGFMLALLDGDRRRTPLTLSLKPPK